MPLSLVLRWAYVRTQCRAENTLAQVRWERQSILSNRHQERLCLRHMRKFCLLGIQETTIKVENLISCAEELTK